jgi:hypothetical protein
MKVKARQNHKWRPVRVVLDFDNQVEYTIFRGIMSLDNTIPVAVATSMTIDIIKRQTGVKMQQEDIRCCAQGIINSIFKRCPKEKKGCGTDA